MKDSLVLRKMHQNAACICMCHATICKALWDVQLLQLLCAWYCGYCGIVFCSRCLLCVLKMIWPQLPPLTESKWSTVSSKRSPETTCLEKARPETHCGYSILQQLQSPRISACMSISVMCVCVHVHDVHLFHNYHELSHPVRSCTILFVHYDSGLFFVSCLWLRRLMLHVLLAVNDMRRCSSLKPGRSEPSCNTAETGSLLSFQSVI